MPILTAGVFYFALVFGAGFVLPCGPGTADSGPSEALRKKTWPVWDQTSRIKPISTTRTKREHYGVFSDIVGMIKETRGRWTERSCSKQAETQAES
jgi:hypothetical protein